VPLRSKDYQEIKLAKNPGHPLVWKQVRESAAAADTDPCQCEMIYTKKETSSGSLLHYLYNSLDLKGYEVFRVDTRQRSEGKLLPND
jgi:hypothetical protein